MKLTTFHFAEDFLEITRESLESNEVVNSLMLGIAENLVKNPQYYGDSDPYLAIVSRRSRHLLYATMTPPYGVVLAAETPNVGKAIPYIIHDLEQRSLPVNDVSGPKPIASQFAQVWTAHHQGSFELEMSQRLYELRAINPVQGVPGEMRQATDADIPLIVNWSISFYIDCFGDLLISREQIKKNTVRNIADGAWHIWQDAGEPASMAMWTRPTRHGISVGGVYTPPEKRRSGYAGACVAALSQKLLDQGYQFCSLFADLSNPTSNNVYQKIGYRPVSDFDRYKLIQA